MKNSIVHEHAPYIIYFPGECSKCVSNVRVWYYLHLPIAFFLIQRGRLYYIYICKHFIPLKLRHYHYFTITIVNDDNDNAYDRNMRETCV